VWQLSMADLESALRRLVKHVEPTAKEKEAARVSHKYLRDLMREGEMGRRIVGEFLSGSYRRNTAIRPLGDVDIIFLIDPKAWPTEFFSFSDKPSPSTVLQSFASALRYRYKQSSAFSQRRSIRLELNHLHIDCVPAIEIPGSDLIWVGDRKEDKWIRSSPKRHEAAVSEVNAANDGLVIPVVKLLKWWNAHLATTAKVRSFVIETMAVTLFQHIRCPSLDEGLQLFFDFVSHFDGDSVHEWRSFFGIKMNVWHTMVVEDSARTGTNVAAGVAYDRMKKFIRQACLARDRLLEAKAARSADVAESRLLAALKFAE